MFVTLEQLRPAFRRYRQSPWVRILLVVISVHLLLFILTPPFHFTPYTSAATDTVITLVIPDYEPPSPPVDEPQIPFIPEPCPYPVPEVKRTVTSPFGFEELPVIPSRDPGPGHDWVHWEKPPVVKHLELPVYPELARQAGIEGTVHVRVVIGTNGKVLDASVHKSDVTESMARTALAAARRCTFDPAIQQGKPVKVTVIIPFEFRLE